MPESVSPAESEPIGVFTSRWLWAARCSALICTIALGVGFAAEVSAHDSMAALITFGRWGLLSLALLYLLFRRGKNSLAFALGLGAAKAFIALLALASIGLSRISLFILAIFSGGFATVSRFTCRTRGVAPLALQYLFGNARVKQYCRIPEDGAQSKRDRETAICLWRRNLLRTFRLADIHPALAFTYRGLPHLSFPCPAARVPTHLARIDARRLSD